MEQFADSYTLSAEGQAIVSRLVMTCGEFAHLADARIAAIESQRVPVLHGHPCQAWIAEPRVQGPFKWWFDWALAEFCKPLFDAETPDFALMVDAAIFPSLTSEAKERLIYHELCHLVAREDEYGVPKLGDDGRVLLKIVPHDYEAFDAEIRRYGPSECGLDAAAVAIAEGYRAQQRKRAEARDYAA